MTLVYLTQALCNAAAPRERRYDLRDSLVRGLFLRVEVSGRKTWYICYRTPSPERRLRNMKIASAAYAQLAAARRAAKEYLARLYLDNVDPAEAQEPPREDGPTLRALIDMYEPWVCAHQKSGAVTVRALRLFSEFMEVPASEIDAEAVARWREENMGRLKRATINRRVAALQALLSWGAKEGLCHAAMKLPKLAQSDSKVVTRFLEDGERARLMTELAAREARSGRDYLRPAVILSLNTGIRKGTLLGLRWGDVKRYGIVVDRFDNIDYVDAQTTGFRVAATLDEKDLRRAIQLPAEVITAGVEPNPRNADAPNHPFRQ